jgi:hypothetical protein
VDPRKMVAVSNIVGVIPVRSTMAQSRLAGLTDR